ncbi:MAG TPA: RES family NAD+ phosphorylase [Bryobacteraceae bacterium]|nr:RES family NAD+ phosphorylase [Bryobacteraceae bacterium]
MRVWRLTARRHAKRAFSGEGARLYGGRWNPPGMAMVYTAGTLSLCALELFVHLDPGQLPDDLVAVSAEIPRGVRVDRLDTAALPRDWRRYPAPESLHQIGVEWTTAGKSAVLAVPSAVIPAEMNYLLNPVHPQFALLRVEPASPFRFDPRMGR